MANTKASKKDIRRIAKRTVQNSAVRTSLKTYVKKSRKATAAGDADATQTALATAVKALDKAAVSPLTLPNQNDRRKRTGCGETQASDRLHGRILCRYCNLASNLRPNPWPQREHGVGYIRLRRRSLSTAAERTVGGCFHP